MKKVLWFLIAFFVLTVWLHGQVVKPSSVTVLAVPGYTSPYQDVVFFNTGTSQLTLTISLSGSTFAIPENRCANGVKPGSHCNVYVTYTPVGIETDNGTLTFAFNGQTISVPLTGEGVQSIPTTTRVTGVRWPYVTIAVSAPDGYKVPDGDLVDSACVIYWGEDDETWVLANGKTTMYLYGCNTQGENDSWYCSITYQGDPEFAPSGASRHRFTPPKC